ncbi:hypothetical protein LQ318_07850 [Aliifodinibius salicampi]|uniref:Uncharacterized protein n=1 Tax=Fodinibius salicampi TaxID=1920655 RepID=A0ABT3PY81_9BACT|nr:hypothetical protein [Fodinibius salicampi]MCW9712815.1 hypothetical protein [Fodinibius salicampi]
MMHEAMHAEMRRYLLDNADTSTLPNFPGSITEDWENYVATRNQETDEANQSNAEHQAMGYEEYITLIAEATSDFDNGRMPFSYYQGLAWVGIYDKDNEGWKNASEAYKAKIRKGYNNAKEELRSRNNDICN